MWWLLCGSGVEVGVMVWCVAIVRCVMAIGECVSVLVFGPNLVVFLAAGSTCGEVSSSGVLRKEFCGQKTHFFGPNAAKQGVSFL